MRNARSQFSLKPRSGISLPDHLRVKFHESSGAAVAYTGKLNGTAYSGSVTFNAAPTWGNGGGKAPTTNTTVYGLATKAAHADLYNTLMPPSGGGLIFLFSYYQTAFTNNSGSPSTLLGWGNVFSGGDGYELSFAQGANNNIALYFRGVGAGSQSSAIKADNNLNVWKTVQMYLDCRAGSLAAYTAVDGNWAAAGTGSSTDSFSHGDPANYTAACIFTSVATGPARGTEYMNRGATDDKIISDLLVIRDSGCALLSSMSTIAAEHALYRRELLRSLDTAS